MDSSGGAIAGGSADAGGASALRPPTCFHSRTVQYTTAATIVNVSTPPPRTQNQFEVDSLIALSG